MIVLLVFTLLFRVMLFNKDFVRDAYFANESRISGSRWDTWYYALYTLFFNGIGDNMPDLMFPFIKVEYALEWFLLVFYFFFMGVIIISILQGYLADNYGGFYGEMLEQILEKDADYKYLI